MKKWFVCLLVLLALVLASSTAMALVYEIYCQVCQKSQDFEPTGRYIAAPNELAHLEIYRCPVCGDEQGTGYDLPHEKSKAATCISQAYCDLCHKYYGDKDPDNHAYEIVYNKVDEVNHIKEEACSRCKKINYTLTEQHTPKEAATCMSAAICAGCNEAYGSPNPNAHNWSDWQPNLFNPNLHYRYCMNIGCSASESESHDGNSNCVTSATCSKCHATYTDTTKHVGPLTYTYKKYDESFHRRIETCTACGNKTGNQVDTQHEESTPANCAHAAWCNVCNQAYGNPNPDNHVWGEWTTDEKTHMRICQTPGCGMVDLGSHTSEPRATCKTEQTCAICNVQYKDLTNHEGERQTRYDYHSESQHLLTCICLSCGDEVFSVYKAHTETIAATCQSPAYCADCQSNYGSKAGHNWSAWSKSDENQHVRTCQTSGCDAVEYAAHTGGSPTCTTAATCADCNVPYYDGTNHEGERKTTYAIDPEDKTRHIATQTCAGCQAVLSTVSEGHTTDKAATCMKGMHCKICDLYYGATVDHQMGRWLPADDGQQHYRTCAYGCGKTEYGKHNVSSPATCAFPAYCKDCGHFGDVDADAHDWSAWKLYDTDQHYRYCRKNKTAHVEYADHTGGTATCETRAMCDVCDEYYGQMLGHDYVMHDAQAATCTEIGWAAYATCSRCDYSTYAEKPALGHDYVTHDAQAPTCTEIGWDAYETCSRCDYSTFAEKPALGHDYVTHDAQAASCTEVGWDAYETCSRCDYSTYAEKPALGHDYAAKTTKPTCTEKGYTTHTCTRCQDSYRDAIVSALGHWYGEWTPNADGTNSASCLRDAYEHTVDCVRFSFVLTAEDVRTEFVLCPVCGEVSEIRLIDENGEVVETREAVRLLLVEDAKAEALTERLPGGELVVRMGALESGEQLMSVVFEWGGEPTQSTGQVKITLPAGLLEGYALCLLSEDGTETELTLEGDEDEETVSFTLDFTNSETPVQVIRLIPEV